MRTRIHTYLAISLSILLSLQSLATDRNDDYTRKLTGTEIKTTAGSNVLQVQDDMNTALKTTILAQQARGLVKLSFNNTLKSGARKVTLTVDVTSTDTDGEATTGTYTLGIEHTNTLGVNPVDHSFLNFEDAVNLKVTIKDIAVTNELNITTHPNSAQFLPELELSASILFERHFSLPALLPNPYNATASASRNFVTVSWDAIPGAEEYDLEWTFVDGYYNTADKTLPPVAGLLGISTVSFNFRNNATRVRLAGNSYKIPMVFEAGYLVFRVRGVSYSALSRKGVITSNWNNDESGVVANSKTTVTTFGVTGTQVAHEPAMNWIHQATFAEEGKRKDVMTYADGLTKPHQAVTYLPSKSEAVAKETVYDEFGRPIVETLPTPTGVNGLKFFREMYTSSKTTGKPLSYTDFVRTEAAACKSGSSRIIGDSATGTGIYYYPRTTTGLDNYVPNSNGYPFTQIEYTGDRTGRVTAQTLPGDTFRLGGGRETRMYYGQPLQEELDRLFGNDVGNASHYKKTLQIDQNRQKSITYVDMMGKTIATSLVGAPPTGMSAIASNPSLLDGIKADLLSDTIVDYDLSTERTILSTESADYSFRYTLSPQAFKAFSCGNQDEFCIDCNYNLDIRIEDECGLSPKLANGDSWPGIRIKNILNNFCDGVTTALADTAFSVRLETGPYKIIKTLSINRDSLNSALDAYLAGDTCLRSFEDFVTDEVAKTDFSGCEIKSCEDACYKEYKNGGTLAQYYNCMLSSECAGIDQCGAQKNKMMMDLYPDGQFGNMNPQTINSTSIYFGGNNAPYKRADLVYLDADGNLDMVPDKNGVMRKPNDLDTTDFRANFQARWGDVLIKLHPEFECMRRCTTVHTDARRYENLMMLVDNYDDAVALNLFNPIEGTLPTAVAYLKSTSFVTGLVNDQFFIPTGQGVSYKADVVTSITNKNYANSAPEIRMSIWEAAAYMATCKETTEAGARACAAQVKANLASYYPKTPDPCFDGVVWDFFRTLYLAERGSAFRKWYYSQPSCDGKVYTGIYANKQQYFANPEADMESQFPGLTTNPVGYGMANSGVANVEANCKTTCDDYKGYWRKQLESCLLGASEATVQNMLTNMSALCASGCDIDNLFGSSSLPAAKPAIIANGIPCRNFAEILLAYNFAPSLICNAALIDNPMPYGFEYTGAESAILPDSCACNTILQAKEYYKIATITNTLPATVTDFDDYMKIVYNIVQPGADAMACGCEKGYKIVTGGSNWNTQVHNWTIAANITNYKYKLNESLPYTQVSPELGCTPCISCNAYQAAVTEAETFLAGLGYNANTPSQQRDEVFYMFLNKLNGALGVDFDRKDIDFYGNTCKIFNSVTTPETTGNEGDTDIVITGVDHTLLSAYGRFWSYLSASGKVTSLACLCQSPFTDVNNLDASPYAFSIGQLVSPGYKPLNCAHTYTYSTTVNNELQGKIADGNGRICDVSLRFKDANNGLKIENVKTISNLKPYAEAAGPVNYFTADATVSLPGGAIQERVQVIGYNSCISFGTAKDPSDPSFRSECLKRPKDPVIDGCREELMTQVVYNASVHYEEYRLSLQNDFAKRYKEQCLNTVQQFNGDFNNGEHHYTLYYYDQAGNLIRTVPPEGVELMKDTNKLKATKAYRAKQAGNIRIQPEHRLSMVYVYNSLNQLTAQYMPDHVAFKNAQKPKTGDSYSSRFYYDRVGRIVLSQNSRQSDMTPPRYSYSVYDNLGRVSESGEIEHTGTITDQYKQVNFPNNLNGPKYEVTRTFYDKGFFPDAADQFEDGQQHLRNRVSSAAYYQKVDGSTKITGFDHATHYSYDIHGNVNTLIQDFAPLVGVGRYKKVDYNYDLISGKVNRVDYQKGTDESFAHRYSYDDDNRITKVETSTDGIIWDKDATYDYYRHGPLARTELGGKRVQGTDYAYTLQGWLKTINGKELNPFSDLGEDGQSSGDVARDAFSMMLTYYAGTNPLTSNDYYPVGSSITGDYANRFASLPASVYLPSGGNLYNGNIRAMTVGIRGMSLMNYNYGYDQLNRIKTVGADFSPLPALAGIAVPTNQYKGDFSYDANGNIKSLTRFGTSTTTAMDNLTYTYDLDGNGKLKSNKLLKVADAAPNAPAAEMRNDYVQNNNNAQHYYYDNIGNLITDGNDSINITWDSRAKIKTITSQKYNGTDLEFAYDGMGNRVMKITKPVIKGVRQKETLWGYTFYVRDASGNILSTNELKVTAGSSDEYTETLYSQGWDIYGSSRLGHQDPQVSPTLASSSFKAPDIVGKLPRNNRTNGSLFTTISLPFPLPGVENSGVSFSGNATFNSRKLGFKQYELTNHLGNVKVVINDRKIYSVPGPLGPFVSSIGSFHPEVVSAQDYYPFGSIMPGRSFSAS
ncbi:MAG: hypothetical protein V4616_12700, partial [Bacteroidota bacterium]